MGKHLLRRGLFVALTAFTLSVLIYANSSRSTYASSANSLAILFSNDTNGYLEPCG
jgi:hypothetical protein